MYYALADRKWRSPAVLGFLAIAVLVVISLWVGGPFPIKAFGHDVFLLLDGGWRIFQGQMPCKDFHSALGHLTYWLFALGFKAVGVDATAICFVYSLVFLGTIGVALFVSRGRFPLLVSLFCALWWGGVGASPGMYGAPFTRISVQGFHNRIGYAWLGIVAVGLLVSAGDQRSRSWRWTDGILLGGLAVLLLFVKVTYGLAIFPLIAVAVAGRRFSKEKALCFALGYLACLSLCLWTMRWSVPEWIKDLQMTAAVKASLPSHGIFDEPFRLNLAAIAWILAVQVCRMFSRMVSGKPSPAFGFLFLETLVFLGVGIGLAAGNYLQGEAAILPALCIVLAVEALADVQNKKGCCDHLSLALAILAASILTVGLMAKNYCSFPYATARKFAGLRQARAFLPENLKSLEIVEGCGGASWDGEKVVLDPNGKYRWWGDAASQQNAVVVNYQDKINDGYLLLKQNTGPQDKICVLDFCNPFSFALLRPSPRGDSAGWHYGYGFNKQFHPDGKKVFQEVDVVMIPRISEHPPTTEAMLEIYQDVLARDFTPAGESPWWRLLKRTSRHPQE